MTKRLSRPKSKPRAPAREMGVTSKQSNVKREIFRPEVLDKSVIAIPLLKILDRDKEEPDKIHDVVIDLNLTYPGGVEGARDWVVDEAKKIIATLGVNKKNQGINLELSKLTRQYLFARLEARSIRELVRRDGVDRPSIGSHAIYHIWPDFEIRPLIFKSISTVKADAAHASFSAFGKDIVWAIMDSGIDASHPHFKRHKNLELDAPLKHEDFTGTGPADKDAFGHGTHVAGIVAGELTVDHSVGAKGKRIVVYTQYRDEHGQTLMAPVELDTISGMAPKCKLISLKVLDDEGQGQVSNVLAAIGKVQEINGNGRRLLIHGVNLSLGYEFDPEWFACGQSPLCVEVDRLVRSGVVVVVAAGNSGYGLAQSEPAGIVHAGLDLTINDPANAELGITVGSTHRDSPHVYGVSYFSSKGPTGDGRVKPDLVAPGEKIISCATGRLSQREKGGKCDYVENSGTSMAAPHVSGVIAAFLSVRREFIGQPERVKQIFLSTATDLRRERYFQGYGLVDLMRAIQSV